MELIDFLIGGAAVAFLLLPGTLIARTRGWPIPWVAGFVTGLTGFFLLVLAYDAWGVPLRGMTLFPIWAVLCVLAWAGSRRREIPVAAPVPQFDRRWLWLLLPGFSIVLFRAVTQPLFGADTIFRWGYLAEEIFARGTLAFYPAVTAADYAVYAWPDGIPPAVSLLYFWVYALAGGTRATLTAAPVVFQFIALLTAAHALARRYARPEAAVISTVLVAGSSITLWATAMGQETGLLALSLVLLLLYLPDGGGSDRSGLTVVAAACAGLGAITREYGLAFGALGAVLLLARRVGPRQFAVFVVTLIVIAAPWYARNWVRTGNPFFNYRLGALFPINAAHDDLMTAYQEAFGWSQISAAGLSVMAWTCLPLIILGAWGAVRSGSRASALGVAALLVAVLWVTSVGYTAAGFTYALRVLVPALVLAAVLGGMLVGSWLDRPRSRVLVAAALGILVTDAALRALTLPVSVYRIPPSQWRAVGSAMGDYHARPVYQQLARTAAGHRMLALGPNALLNRAGADTLPLWSPEVDYLWTPGLDAGTAARRLTSANITFALLNTGAVNHRYIMRIPFFRDGAAGAVLHPIWADEDMALFKIVQPVVPAN